MLHRVYFYRAMHYSAKRGLAIACRLSVRLSVTLVDCDHIHIGWNSSKIISRLVSVGRSLSALSDTLHHGSTPRGEIGNLGSKLPIPCSFERWGHSIANCGRMVTDSAMVTMESL